MSKVYGGVLCKDWADGRTDEVIEVVRFADPDIADAWVQKHAEKRRCPSSKHLGHVILFPMGGSGSSRFDVMPLVVDGLSGGFG